MGWLNQAHFAAEFCDGSMVVFYRVIFVVILITVVSVFAGCRVFRNIPAESGPPAIPAGQPLNPLPVPMLDRELVMDEVSDEIDNYFPILAEERIRNVDGILSEGWIETRPKIGGSVFEPWKRDSTPGFEKLHATLQTIRRFAKVRVIPTAENYLVDVKVYKELEDLPQPVGSTISGRPLRSDNSLDIDRNEVFDVVSKGWIPLGRDISLERVILKNIEARFYEAVQAGRAAESGGANGCNTPDCRTSGRAPMQNSLPDSGFSNQDPLELQIQEGR